MKTSNTSSYNLKTKIFWSVLTVLSLIAVGFSMYESFYYSVQDWCIFGVTAIISVIFGQYRVKLSDSRGYLPIREPAIFWGIIWLGIGGGVLLALIGVLGNFRRGLHSKTRWITEMSAISVTTFLSGGVFYALTKYGFGLSFYPVAGNDFAKYVLAAALLTAGLFHALTYSAVYPAFANFRGSLNILKFWKDSYLPIGLVYLSTAAFIFVVYQLMSHFGLLFGILFLPITIGGHLAYRFHKNTLAQKTKEIRETSRIHLATVETLATAIDARDQIGRGHITRTQIYCLGIGKLLNLSSDELNALKTGALLHNIGKLAVPDHILNKPGRLTPAEMEKAKIHPSVGAMILEKVDFPYPVVPTVKYRHERWDGTGYPKGLKEEEIPLTARILSVADAYDTLRSSRPYRSAVSREDTRKFLINKTGTQFDPKIVDVLLRNLMIFEEEIKEQGISYVSDVENDEDQMHTNQNPGEEYIEQIKRANREVFTLYELARVFSSSLNLEDTYSLFVKKISELVSVDTCVIYILDKSKNYAKAKYVVGKNRNAIIGKKVKPGQGATGFVLKNQQPVYNINPGLDFSFDQTESVHNYTAMASIPLLAGEKLLGAVSIYSCELGSYEDEHMRILETISRIASDAIAQSLKHAETESKALTDPMTFLPNARSLGLHFEKEIARAKRNKTSLQVLMLDLDGFKAINDTHGHKAGDNLLREISKVMRKELRDYDFLARYAGDEFVAVIPETNREAIIELCQRLEKAVRTFTLDVGKGRFASVGVSLGAAAYPFSGDNLDDILVAADKAMYAVKEKRKARLKRIKQQKKQAAQDKLNQANPDKPIFVDEFIVEDYISEVEVIEEKPLVVELDESNIISSTSVN